MRLFFSRSIIQGELQLMDICKRPAIPVVDVFCPYSEKFPLFNSYVDYSNISGFGLFASRDLVVNEVICCYVGEKITKEESQRRNNPDYLITAGDQMIDAIDPLKSSCARYSNDARLTGSNCQYCFEVGDCHPQIVARVFIKKGTEITTNYGNEYWMGRKI